MKTFVNKEKSVFRWVLIDNQLMDGYHYVVKMLDGYFETEEQVYEYYPKYSPDNSDSCYMVKKIDITEAPSRVCFHKGKTFDPFVCQNLYEEWVNQ
jgi:hypothetical protein